MLKWFKSLFRDPRDEARRIELERWVATQLADLPPAQLEAVELFAWASRSGWHTVAQNVMLGNTHPIAKKVIAHD